MKKTRPRNPRRSARWAAAASAVVLVQLCLGVAPARASMDLILADTPDIHFGHTALSYSPATSLLTGAGYSLTLEVHENPPYNIIYSPSYPQFPGVLSLQATIDSSGQLQTGAGNTNTVTFSGYVPQLPYDSGTILTGEISAFGFGGPDDPWHFLFSVTGGDAAALFGGIGTVAGLILKPANFPGDFSGAFGNNGAFGDAGNVVPEPAAMVIWSLLGIAGAAVEWQRRRRRSVVSRPALRDA